MLQLSFAKYGKDSYILIEGKPESDRFFIIQSGKVRIFKEVEVVRDEDSGVLGPGDFLGVIPCMSGHNQIESAVALTNVVVISVRRDQYPDLIKNNTPVAMKIIHIFANKIRSLNETLTQLTLKNTIDFSPAQMYSIAAYYEKMGKINLAVYGYYQYLKACPHGEFVVKAKNRFVSLKPQSSAVYLEPGDDLVRDYPKGTMIFSECQTGQDMFIIQEGQVEITKVADDNEVILAVLKKGDFFGEMALLENKPRSASAIAHTDCRLMTVNRRNFNQMVATQPQLIARLTTTLADRLWSMYRQLRNTAIQDPVGKLFDMLALQLEKARIRAEPGMSHVFDINPFELANMCGIPKEEQNACLIPFLHDPRIKLEGNKIFVTDVPELLKQAEYYRKPRKR